ncbi:MAG: hypothetical protein IID39_00750 [Planctomycetes bacterium]|nr:hypothetical protein [Planctomycetota bacterium]
MSIDFSWRRTDRRDKNDVEKVMMIKDETNRSLTMRIGRQAPLMLALAFAWCAAPAPARDSLPSGEKIMDNYVRNTGGKAAYKRITNRVMKGKLAMAAMNMTMSFVEYSAEPNYSYSRMESEMMGTVEEGTNGDVAWSIHPMRGNNLKSGAERDLALRDGFFHNWLKWRDIYTEAKCVDVAEFEGEKCYKVVLTPKAGDELTQFFEKDTGLLRGIEMSMETMMGKMAVTVILQDYKEVYGILYPHIVTQKLPQMEMVLAVESIEHNVDMPKDRFKLPDEIVALIELQKDAEKDAAKPEKEKSDD